MNPATGFVLFLLLTVALLGGVTATGLRAKRKLHLRLVACALVALGVTIYFAEVLGESFDLEPAGVITPIHLNLAKLTTFAYLAPLFTGYRTLKDPTWRRRHRICALLVLVLTLLTAATGLWMILASEPLPA